MHLKTALILYLTSYNFCAQAIGAEDQLFPQESYIKASNPDETDSFGNTAISGDVLVVTTTRESSNSTGINGDESDNTAASSGAAYVFSRDQLTGWAQEAYIKSSNSEAEDQFGFSAAISGDTLVVGANFEDSSAQGVDGDQNNNLATWSGAVYVFTRNNGSWIQEAYLKSSNNKADDVVSSPGRDQFGGAVAIYGDTLVVGAIGEDSSAVGINGEEDDEGASLSGAVYVFVREQAGWVQQAYIKASNTNAGDLFGDSVALYEDTLVVGAPGEQSASIGINGDEDDNTENSSGAVYVFMREQGAWTQQAYIKASNAEADDRFGKELDIYEDIILVGAAGESSSATIINGDQNDNSAEKSGAAYLFSRNQGLWSQQAYLKPSNTETFDAFGFSVSLTEDKAIVGARGEGSNATGIGGAQDNNLALGSGAVYLFSKSGSNWSQAQYIKASNAEEFDAFGSSVSIESDGLIVSARGESSAATGVDGDQNNNDTLGSGAVYTFNLDVIFSNGFDSF